MVKKEGKLMDTAFYYDDHDGKNFGLLGKGQLDIPIYVDTGSDAFSSRISLTLAHNAFLNVLGYSANIGIVYSQFTNTLTSFIAAKDPIIKKYFVPARCSATDRIHSTYVPDHYRPFLRGIIEFIMYLHDNKVSLCSLSLEKIFAVLDSNLKIHSLKFSRTFSADTIKQDFKYLHSVLTKLFPTVVPTNQPTNPPKSTNPPPVTKSFSSVMATPPPSKPPSSTPSPTPLPVPRDIQHLLDLLKDYSNSSEELVKCHLAILTSKERITVVRNFWEKRKFIGANEQYYFKCVEAVGSKYKIGGRPCDDWIVYMESRPPNLGPIKDCYLNIDKRTGERQSFYGHDGTNMKMNVDLVKFCRHLSTHIAEHMTSYRQISNPITEWEVDQIVMALFDEFLLALEVQLHTKRLLKTFL